MVDSDCSESHAETQNQKKVRKQKKELPPEDPMTSEDESDNDLFDEEDYMNEEEEAYENNDHDNDSSCSIDAFEFFSRYLENEQEESIIDVLTGIRDNGNDTRNAILKVAKELHNLNANISKIVSGMMEEEEEPQPRRSKKNRS